ncbi:MAG TPA: HD domain-containing phosphohydrolase, partial [Treponemataceae bacterium]|nr:HD domain-containing phosphohydrolase [Treponemataceae bacterium]
VKDAYTIGDDSSFKFNPEPDRLSGYRTKSMLTIPLISESGKKMGVFQIINALDDNNNVVEFTKQMEHYMNVFATFATQALIRAARTRAQIMRQIAMAEMRDPKETGAHVQRVSSFAIEIYDYYASKNNISEIEREEFRDNLKIAAILHDVGKVGIPDEVLHHPGRFVGEFEWMRKIINTHVALGAMLFYPPQDKLDQMCLDVNLHHHAKWDGTGYPGALDMKKIDASDAETMLHGKSLSGQNIPLAARIVAMCDVYDALSHKRSYKEAWAEDKVLKVIQEESALHFDPEIVYCFFEVIDRIRAINKQYPEEN